MKSRSPLGQEETFTPGPWVAALGTGHHENHIVITADHAGMTSNTPLAHVSNIIDDAWPDARLIAAAPDLLKALKACVEALDSDEMKGVWSYLYTHSYLWTGPTVDMIATRAAILKATSSSSPEGGSP